MQTTTRWSFTTFFNGVRGRSPRVFDTKEEAIQAIVEKLSIHALDNEFPCIGLIAIGAPLERAFNDKIDSGSTISKSN
jgi:hypothetical protein